jgi:hypothetical protein
MPREPHDEREHFRARHATHVICCSLRPGHILRGDDRMSEADAKRRVSELNAFHGGKMPH